MDQLTCQFCNSRIGPILPQDMGGDRVMHLCGQCRRYIREGSEQDARVLARRVAAELPSVIRASMGKRTI